MQGVATKFARTLMSVSVGATTWAGVDDTQSGLFRGLSVIENICALDSRMREWKVDAALREI